MMKAAKNTKSAEQRNEDVTFTKASKQWERGELLSAFRLFLSAAKRGDASAQHNLGYFYDVGLGVKPNRRAALYWYERAYRCGYRTAASNIGTIFRDDGDTERALWWFQRAVDLGDADANLEIAKILIDEQGTERRAIPYLKRTIKAKPDDSTIAAKQEAQRLLRKLVR